MGFHPVNPLEFEFLGGAPIQTNTESQLRELIICVISSPFSPVAVLDVPGSHCR